MYDIIIVGAGPAGLTAAIYGRRAGKKVLVLEANSYGGQIINTLNIENYPGNNHISGFDLASNMYNQAKELGTLFVFEKVIGIKNKKKEKVVITKNNKYVGKTIILATGSENRKFGIEGEDKLIGKGISYCATCDGAFYKDKIVAVVGGGNTALEDALYLSDTAKKVYLIHRRDSFRGEERTLDKLKDRDNVHFILNSSVTKFIYDDVLKGITVTNIDGSTNDIDIDGLFVAIGRIPENQSFAKVIDLDSFGYIVAGEDCHTNINGIYVCGDARTKDLRQLVTATGDGAVASSEAIKYINNMK